MRIVNKMTGHIDYSQKEYHRLMYNHYCNPLSNPLKLYVFQRPTGLQDKKGIEIYEGDIIKTERNTVEVFFGSKTYDVIIFGKKDKITVNGWLVKNKNNQIETLDDSFVWVKS